MDNISGNRGWQTALHWALMSLTPVAVTVQRGSVERWGRRWKTVQILVHPTVWGTKVQKMLSIKVIQYPFKIRRQGVSCPLSLQQCTSSLAIQLDTRHQARCWMSCSTSRSCPLGPRNGWQLLLLLKHMLSSQAVWTEVAVSWKESISSFAQPLLKQHGVEELEKEEVLGAVLSIASYTA